MFAGGPALSTFALSKIQRQEPAVCYAEFVHVLQLNDALDDDARAQIEQLLTYGPQQNLPAPCGVRALTVMPRTGTISPWSSKASDIFALCGLHMVSRVERGVRWFVESEGGCETAESAGVT